jgi:predicted short-subunit dehydrogenase-like oxidoreductase (DUF2520 family)
MIKVVLIGGGNVAFHLAKAFLSASKVSLVQVYNRNIESIKHLEKETLITDSIDELIPSDITIISVSDDAIGKIAKKIHTRNSLVVHTSGSTSIAVLKIHKRHGVFYPLQSFSKSREIAINTVPICVEATNEKDLALLNELAAAISTEIHEINSNQRKQVHTAAVFVNNFVNHLYAIGTEICNENSIAPNILNPLIIETAKKITQLTPFDAQTGPARRGDKLVIKNHLENLSGNHQEIYKLLTQSIADKYGKKL